MGSIPIFVILMIAKWPFEFVIFIDRNFSSDDDDDEWEEGLDGDRGGGEGKRKGKSKAIGQVRRLHLKPR